MRSFLAFCVPDAQSDALATVQARVPAGRPVDEDAFHITLLFLGDPPDSALDDLHSGLDGIRIVMPPLTIGELGHFGHDAPRLAWAGVSPGAPLADLNARLSRAARNAGIALEKRRFVPHVTLTRYARHATTGLELATAYARVGKFALPPFQPTALHLISSTLTSKGPRYETLASYPVTPD